jgi:FKBP-type peptidyl-prolyl cis-trans isomerase SlyD
MQITANKVAVIHYSLKDSKKELIETSIGNEPLAYLHGAANLISGLEDALEGKKAGDKFSVTVGCAEAYGDYDKELVEVVPKSDFENQEELEVGKEFQYDDEDGNIFHVRILKVDADNVTVDGNHPLAGQDLSFDIEVLSVRDATDEELEHGHVHQEGHHHH